MEDVLQKKVKVKKQKKSKKRKKAISNIAFDTVNLIIIALLCVIFLLPFWMVVISSFTANSAIQMNGYQIIPEKLSLEGYKYVFSASEINFVRAIGNSLFVSLMGCLITVILTLFTAYVLSKKQLVGYKFINAFYLVTMFFAGGMIPLFLVVRAVGLYDSIWALIIPGAFNLYYVILVRSYFFSLPDALEEAAVLDGANDFQILVKVFLPISVPMVLTIAFFCFVDKWNGWIDALLYLSPQNTKTWPLQFVLKNMLEDMSILGSSASGTVTPVLTAKSVGVVIAILPLMVIFPIIQRYFVNGITIGAVKG
ncbi:MAG: carbohydrate ABC transporter permease [Clostridia bacterium]|nr:carbohydrate ABC transporter permease [Clostridia bacterium]